MSTLIHYASGLFLNSLLLQVFQAVYLLQTPSKAPRRHEHTPSSCLEALLLKRSCRAYQAQFLLGRLELSQSAAIKTH